MNNKEDLDRYGNKKEDNKDDSDELGVMEEGSDSGDGVDYSEFMEQGYYKGVTTNAEQSKHGDYDYIDIYVDMDIETPDDLDIDSVELSFGIPVPESLKERGVISERTMLADFLKEIDQWSDNDVLSLSDLVGHKIRFMVKPSEGEDGNTYMNVVRTIDDEFAIQGV